MTFSGITFALDHITFRVSGAAPQRFLSMAADRKLRLWQIRCIPDGGYTALARGADLAALESVADDGGWQFTLVKRHGPGPWGTRALHRPGVPVGFVLFIILIRFLGGFVWHIDFGDLAAEEQAALRALLARNDIYEGAHPSPDALTAVRQQIAAQTDQYGWVNINFTGGYLSVESSPSRFEPITPPVPDVALYAAAEGKVLRVETESGFPLVAPGQYVAEGQLLVDHLRTRRSGAVFTQGASGAIVARVVRSYAATQPTTLSVFVPSGARSESLTLHFMGQEHLLQEGPDCRSEAVHAEWVPLRIGRVALPGCLFRVTLWPRQKKTLRYTTSQATALAARTCRRQLLAEFPDALIEAQQRTDEMTEQGAHCTLRYTFCANIARPQ